MAKYNFSKETLKTIGGVVLIAVIVVATFLYGNKQRQEQLRQQQAQQNTQSQQQVKSPGAGSVNTPAPTTATPPSGTTPQTGGEMAYLLPLAALIGLYQLNRYQASKVHSALRR